MNYKNIAGISIKGGNLDKFFFSLLEYYPDSKRWFLKSLLQVKDSESLPGNDAIKSWISKYQISELVVDIPLTKPPCITCQLECPGELNCDVDIVRNTNEMIENILKDDEKFYCSGPKGYERKRNEDDQYIHDKNMFRKKTIDPILSKSFKRRLKKGFSPYWNRPIDLWIWMEYYDQMLDLFNVSYTSFGTTSLMTLFRFSYLKRHFPEGLKLFEGNILVAYIELIRSDIVKKETVLDINHFEFGSIARLEILKNIEKKLGIFIYDHDYEILLKNILAFNSFILSVLGRNLHLGHVKKLEENFFSKGLNFVIPHFLPVTGL